MALAVAGNVGAPRDRPGGDLMGSSTECVEQTHEACVATWCDCGCHHALIAAHHDGAHAAPDWRCQHCLRVARGEPDAVTHEDALVAIANDHRFGEHPTPHPMCRACQVAT